MGFRFRRRIKIAPGLRLNLSKSGGSLSVGGRGATLNLGKRGKRMTVGVPGSGIFYTKQLGRASGPDHGPAQSGFGLLGRIWHWILIAAVVTLGLLWLIGYFVGPG